MTGLPGFSVDKLWVGMDKPVVTLSQAHRYEATWLPGTSMRRRRRFVEVMAIAAMFAMTLSMYLVWASAYVNDGQVTYVIDEFGEEFLELFVWTVLIPVVVLGVHTYFRGEEPRGEQE